MNSIFKFFTPKDKKFQPLFEQAASNARQIAEALLIVVNTKDFEKRKEAIKEVERLEHVGDDITHTIFIELSKNFITPFDREDIHALASAIDDIADYIHASASNIELYNVSNIGDAMIKLSELLVEMCMDLEKAVKELRSFKNIRVIADACVRINSGENQADYVCNLAIARLFEFETNAIELIKQKEVLQTLEMATDKCEDAANVLESILVKNAELLL
jgi:predicted phosphate transport protein (TIGR00153 family)